MLNIAKITNKDDEFIISWYSPCGNKMIIVNSANIIEEINKAFDVINEENKERMRREGVYQNQCSTGALSAGLASSQSVIKA